MAGCLEQQEHAIKPQGLRTHAQITWLLFCYTISVKYDLDTTITIRL